MDKKGNQIYIAEIIKESNWRLQAESMSDVFASSRGVRAMAHGAFDFVECTADANRNDWSPIDEISGIWVGGISEIATTWTRSKPRRRGRHDSLHSQIRRAIERKSKTKKFFSLRENNGAEIIKAISAKEACKLITLWWTSPPRVISCKPPHPIHPGKKHSHKYQIK